MPFDEYGSRVYCGTCPYCGANADNQYQHSSDCYANLPGSEEDLGNNWRLGWNNGMTGALFVVPGGLMTGKALEAYRMGERCGDKAKAEGKKRILPTRAGQELWIYQQSSA